MKSLFKLISFNEGVCEVITYILVKTKLLSLLEKVKFISTA